MVQTSKLDRNIKLQVKQNTRRPVEQNKKNLLNN